MRDRRDPRLQVGGSFASGGVVWGEFLDYEWYYDVEPVAPRVDPWRTDQRFSGRTVMVSREILERLMIKKQYQWILLNDAEKVDLVRASVCAEGLREPLTLVVDRAGWLVLKDGHHRLLATEGLSGYESLPCVIKTSEKIKVSAANISEVLFDLLV